MSHTFLVGYGTLLDRASLGHTIGGDASNKKAMVPVWVRGYRRLFNLRPTHYEPSFYSTEAPIEAAAMNVEKDPGAEFNGLAFQVTLEELEVLDQRERYYLREVTPLLEFTSGKELGEGHLYAAERDAPWLERDPLKLLPKWRDIVLARRGSYAISREFGQAYDRTTFLADGRTLMLEHYARWLEGSPAAAGD